MCTRAMNTAQTGIIVLIAKQMPGAERLGERDLSKGQSGGGKSERFQGNGHSQMLVVEHVFGHRCHSLKRVCALYLQQLGHGSSLDVQ